MLHFVPGENIYVYFRYDNKQKIMVILRLNKKNQIIDLSRFKEILPETFSAFHIISGKKLEVANFLLVPANKSMIMEIN